MIHVVVVIAVVLVVVLVVVVEALIRVIMEHLGMILLCLGVGLPVIVLVLRAIGRGMLHHTRLSWNPPAIEAGPRLPALVRSVVLDEPKNVPPSAFSTEMTAEPEEAEETLCEGPGCEEVLGEMKWTVDAVTEEDGKDPVTDTHSFCSRECAEAYTGQAREHEVVSQ